MVPGLLHSSLADMLPQQLLGGVSAKSRDHWTQTVIGAFDKMGLATNKYSKAKVLITFIAALYHNWTRHINLFIAIPLNTNVT